MGETHRGTHNEKDIFDSCGLLVADFFERKRNEKTENLYNNKRGYLFNNDFNPPGRADSDSFLLVCSFPCPGFDDF